jgi:flagellar motor protein MotB
MIRTFTISAAATFLAAIPAISQQPEGHAGSVPLYRVTVIHRQVDAVNYQYRSGPTKVNFRGTVLMANAKGEATVESQRGRTEITAKFDHVLPSSRFGREYLTYVLWAITPEGSPHNLGEVVPDGSDHATIHVTTELQAFGLLVTAEPYSASRQVSDVVVLENEVRPDTIGKVQPIRVSYDLMPRGHYTWNVPENAARPEGPKVSMRQYEAISQVYQAQNALGMASAANAAQLAPNTFSEAERMLAEAKRLQSIKADTSLIVQSARAAAQTAEDARVIAERRGHEKELAEARNTAAAAEQAKLQAEAAARQARVDADEARAANNEARARADAERVESQRAEAAAAAAPAETTAAPHRADRIDTPGSQRQRADAGRQSHVRMQLLENLNGAIAVRDTPRGLVATIPDDGFSGSTLRSKYAASLARVAALVSAEPGLQVTVEGNSDSASSEAVSTSRASEVRDALVKAGVAPAAVQARGLGAARLLTSNATESGRIANRRVEIVISGSPIGDSPFWSPPYSLMGQGR